MSSRPKPTALDSWIDRLSGEEMPAFAHTARSLASVSREDDSSANDLANVILHDSAMTARILRLANSVHYNASGRTIETVSYAIVILGFQNVRNMALTISMIDTVLNAAQKEKVQQEMICAYHAAIQAQRLAEQTEAKDIEAVYIGALLHRLGQIMFWCYPFDYGEVLLSRYNDKANNDDIEHDVLGFSLHELTTGLVSEWNLSAMLDEVLTGKKTLADENTIATGLAIADAAQQGWHSDAFNHQLEVIAKQLSLSVNEAREYVFDGARIANNGLHSFGFPQTSALLPPDEIVETSEELDTTSKADLELAILRQLTQMLGENLDLNKVGMAVLEGIYRVVEMDTVVFALVDRKTKGLIPKLMLGSERDHIMSKTAFPMTDGEFTSYLGNLSAPAWHKPGVKTYQGKPDPLISLLDAQEFFISPITIGDRVIGAIYANRQHQKKSLTASNLQSFCHLSGHVTLAFKILSAR